MVSFKKINLNFEKKKLYVLLSPFFFIIALYIWLKKKIITNPRVNFYFFDGVSKNCKEIKENAGNWRALDIVYNYQKGSENMFADFWHNLRPSQATRNRLKLIKYLLLKNIENIVKKNKEVRLVSIASGSAQGVIEVIAEAKKREILVRAVLIDLDKNAIEHSKRLAQKMKIENQITFINKPASFVKVIGKDFKPNLIEMIGFLEYRPFNKAVKLIKNIQQALENEGVFLVSQITYNLEMFFLKEVINWSMVYRKPKELAKILSLANFNLEDCLFYWEPFKIHYIAECKKT